MILFLILFISYLLLFIFSIRIKDNSIVDVFWSIGFMMIAVITYFDWVMGITQSILTWLILIWGIRLSSHIGFRKIFERKEDPRYAKWREEWGNSWYFYIRSFLQIYILQMILFIAVSLAIIVVNLLWKWRVFYLYSDRYIHCSILTHIWDYSRYTAFEIYPNQETRWIFLL